MNDIPKFLMTELGYRLLCDEYDLLLKIERPKIVETVSWAASNGDRSENADYQYGKKRLREIDKRLEYLEKRITNAKVINNRDKQEASLASFGATVTVSFENAEEKIFRIVGEDELYTKQENDAILTRISYQSPLGKLLEGKRVGDELLFRRPKGDVYITIEKIEFIEDLK